MIKDRLMKALKVAAASYNDGAGANEAVAKAASDADFNEKQAERLCEMFNTLAALNKEKDKDDPTGSCELVSKQAVAKLLLDGCTQKKEASAPEIDYSFYSGNPTKTNLTIEARSSGMSGMAKAASAPVERVPDELNVSQRSLYKIIEGKIGNLKEAAAAADDVARQMKIEIEQNAVKIAKAIEYSSESTRLADMFKAACEHQKAVELVSEYSTKVAESVGGEYAKMSVFDAEPVEDLLKIAASIEQDMSSVAEYESKRDRFLSKAAEASNEMMEAVGLAKKASEPTLADLFCGVVKIAQDETKKEENTEPDAGVCVKIANMIRESGVQSEEVARLCDDLEKDAAGAALTNVISIPAPFASKTMDALMSSDKVDNERSLLLNVRRSIILADLMANDPIIRDADPNQVSETYKAMVMTSPRVSLDKAQVRSFLRSAVNSIAVSPSDAKVISDVDRGVAMSHLERMTNLDSSIKDSNRA